MAALFNLLGALSGTAVATTIGKGIVDINADQPGDGRGLALAVVIWSSPAAYFGLPTSESHGILAAIAGSGRGDRQARTSLLGYGLGEGVHRAGRGGRLRRAGRRSS